MGDKRKLQAEIDRCLKRVHEGTTEFEDIWQKVQNATNTNQKEKFEADLKKEIKKLQRLRDQIKTWMQSNDIKDKRPLQDARKLIETHMERFKVMERDTKTKAYSKEGLGKEAKVDPREQAKEETSECLSEMVEQLNLQVEQFEAEVEQLKSRTSKKKDKDKVEKAEEIGSQITKHRYYISKMEMLRRMLENNTVEPEEVRSIEDTLKDYIERSTEPDFIEDDGVFEGFNFDGTMDSIPTGASDSFACGMSTSSKNDDEDSTTSSQITSPSPRKASTTSIMTFSLISTGSKTTLAASPAAVSSTFSTNTNPSGAVASGIASPTLQKPTAVKPPLSPNAAAASSNSVQSAGGPVAITKLFSAAPSSQSIPSSTNSCSSVGFGKSGSSVTTGYSVVAGSNMMQSAISCGDASTVSSGLTLKCGSSISSDRVSTPQAESSADSLVSSATSETFPSLQSQAAVFPPNLNSSFSNPTEVDNVRGMASNGGASSTSSITPGATEPTEMTFASAAGSAQFSAVVTTSNGPLSANNANSFNSIPSQINSNFGDNAKDLSKTYSGQFATAAVAAFGGHSGSTSASCIVSHGGDASSSTSVVNSSYSFSTANSLSINLSSNTTCVATSVDTFSASKTSFASLDAPSSMTPGLKDSIVPPDATYFERLRRQEEQYRTETTIPPLLGVAPLGPVKLGKEHVYQQSMLEAAFEHLPHASDSERLRPYLPRNPCPTPNYYPKEPLANSDTVEFFEKLATETLFFIFYYLEGTKAQYLAAKALKKQSWRFHTKYMMWFQRHEEPKQITDDCEMGSYIYFDYEKWTQRRKEGFTFEYRFLEDRDLK